MMGWMHCPRPTSWCEYRPSVGEAEEGHVEGICTTSLLLYLFYNFNGENYFKFSMMLTWEHLHKQMERGEFRN